MRSRSSALLLGIAIIFCVFLAACGSSNSNGGGGGGGGGSTPPVISTSSLPGGTVGTAYSQTLLATSGTPPYTWSVTSGSLPAGLSLSSGGTISGTPTTPGQSTFTVQVTDSKSLTASASLSITIEGVVTITTSSLPGGQVGSAYSATLAASGGTAPYTWSVVAGSGNLPNGLSLSSGGVISGTPTAIGKSSFTVQAKDSESTPATATKQLSITVQGVVTITTQSLPAGALNVPYSANLAATGGVSPYTWSITSGNLPNGLSLNASTGAITGTPTAPGAFPFAVQVADSESPQVTATANLSITISLVVINNTALPSGIQTVPYSATLTAAGGTPPYAWSITQGGLPNGLTLNGNTGIISGTPGTTAQNQTFTVQVADSSQPALSNTAQLTIDIGKTAGGAILSGSYAFSFNGYSAGSNKQPVFMVGSFVADGKGNITSGVLDKNGSSPPANLSITGGTYVIQAYGLGAMTLNTSAGPFNFAVSVNSTEKPATHGTLTLNGTGPQIAGSGVLIAQTAGVTLAQLVGNYASGYFGVDPSFGRVAGAGAYQIDQAFTLAGTADQNDAGTLSTVTTSDGILPSPDPNTGRGEVTLQIQGATTHWVFYVVSANELNLISADPISSPAKVVLQSLLRQPGSPTFDNSYLYGASVFQSSGITQGPPVAATALIGLFTADGAGNGKVVLDSNQGGTIGQENHSGTYTVAANGRVTLGGGFGSGNPVFYLVNLNQAFAVGADSLVLSGYLEPQTGPPPTNLSFINSYWGGTETPAVAAVTNTASWLFPDGNGTFIGAACSGSGCPGTTPLSGTYQVDNTGRAVLSSGGNAIAVFYVISPTKVALLPTSATDTNPALAVFTSN